MTPMIFTLTDFGTSGPYLGEMEAVLVRNAPAHPVVHLMSDLPAFAPRESAYLLDAIVSRQPEDSVFVCVVDPGVGTAERRPVWLEADGRVLVGPDNGLMHVVAARARSARWFEITWRPKQLSASFHGRDLFAPVAACLSRGESVMARRLHRRSGFSSRWPEDLDAIVYVDGYGNAMTGRRANTMNRRHRVLIASHQCRFRRTFGDAPRDEPFWYENSLGLVEVALREDSAAARLGIGVGTRCQILNNPRRR